MRKGWILVVFAAGCQHASSRVAPVPHSATGVYAFQLLVGGREETGTILLTPDTATISPKNAICIAQPTPVSIENRVWKWSCSGIAPEMVSLSINPLVTPPVASWSRVVEHTQQKRICLSSKIDPATGKEICTEYGSEPVQVNATDGGIVHLTAVVAPERRPE